jgi:hypothetical protein
MWIFCCGMIRSASTLQYQIVAHIVEAAGLGQRVPFFPPDKFPAVVLERSGDPSWKVAKMHTCTTAAAAQLKNGSAVGVCSFRDVRDIIVSLMEKEGRPFEKEWAVRVVRGCLQNFERWTRHPQVLVSRYEDLLHRQEQEVARVATHIGLELDAAKYRQIAAEYSIPRQRQRIEQLAAEHRFEGKRGKYRFDPESLLHANHIKSEGAAGWKSVLTAEQVYVLERESAEWLQEHGYPLLHGKS